jgi:hypothetical protein
MKKKKTHISETFLFLLGFKFKKQTNKQNIKMLILTPQIEFFHKFK